MSTIHCSEFWYIKYCNLHCKTRIAHRGPGVDSFLVPQWGGVMFYNPLEILNNETNVFVRMETVMPTIIKQLKLLFGLQTEEVSN